MTNDNDDYNNDKNMILQHLRIIKLITITTTIVIITIAIITIVIIMIRA